jgi:tetratricopeptide (TPR) repeat protein
LLDWHLRRGTRPGGEIDHPGRQWGVKEFAGAVGLGDRTIRYWLNDQHLPPEIETIERVLFGKDVCYAEWRLELRRAHATSQGGEGYGVAPAPTVKMLPASNIPIRVPTHFMGRDKALLDVEAALKRDQGRVAITALHGLRGVGKTTLAAAYADRHRGDYRATWWIRAQTEPSMRADLVALGVRLGWAGAEDEEEPALAAVMERLRHEGEGILLIFDNAIDADAVKLYLPPGGAAKVLVTSNAHTWRAVAAPVEIRLWPKVVGADYLIVRTGREKERAAAEALSDALGGLPLALEQAAAYCERLDISIEEYRKRFETAPARFMDDARHAPAEYHDRMTVAKTFALAIEEAANQRPASEPLIVHAALLAPEPIPLFLFAEARQKFGEPLASALCGDGLDDIVATLRTFALIDRETIVDERDATITTDTVRLHRLVRMVAAARRVGDARLRRTLVDVVAAVYPEDVLRNPKTWPRARRLDAHAVALVAGACEPPVGAEERAAELLTRLARYSHSALAAYEREQSFCELALRIRERVLGAEHPDTVSSLNNLGFAVEANGDLMGARALYERALAINERIVGPGHQATATNLHNLGRLLLSEGDPARARSAQERALAIFEKMLGPEHSDTALGLHNLARTLQAQSDFAGARSLYERALAINEKVLGPENPYTASYLNSIAHLRHADGDLVGARPLYERALAIREKVLGPEHPRTAWSLVSLARVLQDSGDFPTARPLFERALAIYKKTLDPTTNIARYFLASLLLAEGNAVEALRDSEAALAGLERALGKKSRWTKDAARTTADALDAVGRAEEAAALRARYRIEPGQSQT